MSCMMSMSFTIRVGFCDIISSHRRVLSLASERTDPMWRWLHQHGTAASHSEPSLRCSELGNQFVSFNISSFLSFLILPLLTFINYSVTISLFTSSPSTALYHKQICEVWNEPSSIRIICLISMEHATLYPFVIPHVLTFRRQARYSHLCPTKPVHELDRYTRVSNRLHMR
jgi:hypothetical protein